MCVREFLCLRVCVCVCVCVRARAFACAYVLMDVYNHRCKCKPKPTTKGWQQPTGRTIVQVSFRNLATNSRSLLRENTYHDQLSLCSSPPCMQLILQCFSCRSVDARVCMCICMCRQKYHICKRTYTHACMPKLRTRRSDTCLDVCAGRNIVRSNARTHIHAHAKVTYT